MSVEDALALIAVVMRQAETDARLLNGRSHNRKQWGKNHAALARVRDEIQTLEAVADGTGGHQRP